MWFFCVVRLVSWVCESWLNVGLSLSLMIVFCVIFMLLCWLMRRFLIRLLVCSVSLLVISWISWVIVLIWCRF